MAEAAEPTSRLNPLKKLYFELGQQLNAGEVEALKDLFSGEQLTKEEAENVETARGLFNLLTEKGFISEDNLELLEELFETIDRPHLKDKVKKFQQDRGARRKRKACELSMKASVKQFKSLPKEEPNQLMMSHQH
ncbi:uncharacterized protein [Ptychodera flava]|uniref:uncharacterized protein n=1 Tax=Ptychodera flava TaxID=63121 RepID=UPI00396A81E6